MKKIRIQEKKAAAHSQEPRRKKSAWILQTDCLDHVADGRTVHIGKGFLDDKDEVTSALVRKNLVNPIIRHFFPFYVGRAYDVSAQDIAVPVLLLQCDEKRRAQVLTASLDGLRKLYMIEDAPGRGGALEIFENNLALPGFSVVPEIEQIIHRSRLEVIFFEPPCGLVEKLVEHGLAAFRRRACGRIRPENLPIDKIISLYIDSVNLSVALKSLVGFSVLTEDISPSVGRKPQIDKSGGITGENGADAAKKNTSGQQKLFHKSSQSLVLERTARIGLLYYCRRLKLSLYIFLSYV